VHSTHTVTPGEVSQLPVTQLAHEDRAPNGFELVLIEAMVAAAKADGHIDAGEQRRLFAEVEHLSLDAESKAYVFDLLSRPVDPSRLEVAAGDPEQAAQVYLASRLAIDPDNPAEQAYLDELASRMQLPGELRAHLERQAAASP
jgi:uncharacterized membrane protein YebE (DUF533 family)